jgi:hypothetical protein
VLCGGLEEENFANSKAYRNMKLKLQVIVSAFLASVLPIGEIAECIARSENVDNQLEVNSTCGNNY